MVTTCPTMACPTTRATTPRALYRAVSGGFSSVAKSPGSSLTDSSLSSIRELERAVYGLWRHRSDGLLPGHPQQEPQGPQYPLEDREGSNRLRPGK